jgi:type II secretory pathway pseudopilin PulG
MESSAACRWLRGRPSRDEDGFALVTTVLTMAVLAAFSLVLLQQTISGTAGARKDQDWVAALGAAQAGLDDYLSRLNETDGSYYVYSTANPDPGNPAMGTDASGPQWAPVATAGGESARGHYHYDVDTAGYTGTASQAPNGNIVVESTGRVGARTRTLSATVRRAGFVDFVYFTDLETPDPLSYSTQAERDAAAAQCSDYYGIRPGPPTCTDISFSGDSLSGPVHSNDTMLVCSNVTFKDVVTTMSGPIAANDGKHYRTDGCGSTTGTSFSRPADPSQVAKVELPSTNLSLKHQTSAAASPRGCLYVGPTKIVISGAQIHVTSPWTKAVTPGCQKDAFFPIPVNGVVYVDVVPADGTSDDNSWGATELGKPACLDPTHPQYTNNVGYPISGENGWHYPCRAGDVFIEQLDGSAANALDGRMTVSANNSLYVTNHLDYAGGTSGSSFLGLIAEQFLYIWHPTRTPSSWSGNPQDVEDLDLPGQSTPFQDARISAALLSVNHTITVQSHRLGASLGTLHITGALTQKYRGSVRTVINGVPSGYAKNYVYDQRLHYDAPPRFLNPALSSFSAVRTAEAPPAYR